MKLQFCKFWAILFERQDQKNGLVSEVKKKKGQLNLNKTAASLKSWPFYICLIRKTKSIKDGQQDLWQNWKYIVQEDQTPVIEDWRVGRWAKEEILSPIRLAAPDTPSGFPESREGVPSASSTVPARGGRAERTECMTEGCPPHWPPDKLTTQGHSVSSGVASSLSAPSNPET